MKLFLGLILGLVIGAAATWFLALRHSSAGHDEAKKEEYHAAEHTEEGVVKLDKTKQAASGIETAQPKPAQFKPEIKGYGRVLDPAPLVSLFLDFQAAEAALAVSAKEHDRTKALFAQNQNASARALETAEATLKRDQILLNTAKAKLQTTFGPKLANREDLTTLVESLSKLENALVRIDLPPTEVLSASPLGGRVSPVADQKLSVDAELLGPAASADSQFQGQGFLLLVRTNALLPNAAVVGYLSLPGPEINGFIIPSKALLQDGSDLVVFIQAGEETFKKVGVEPERTTPEGAFVTAGIKAEDRIVVSGAQEILSETTKGPPEE